jgi:hypothetical protein
MEIDQSVDLLISPLAIFTQYSKDVRVYGPNWNRCPKYLFGYNNVGDAGQDILFDGP